MHVPFPIRECYFAGLKLVKLWKGDEAGSEQDLYPFYPRGKQNLSSIRRNCHVDHPIQALMTTAMENLKEMIDVNTIIGDPVETPDGSVILTVSKVRFGLPPAEVNLWCKVMPEMDKDNRIFHSAEEAEAGIDHANRLLIVNAKEIKMVHLDESTHLYERILDLAPQAVDKIQQIISEKKQNGKKDPDKPGGSGGGGQTQS